MGTLPKKRYKIVETSGYPVRRYAPKFYRPGHATTEILILDTWINHKIVARWTTVVRKDRSSDRLAYLRNGAIAMAKSLEEQYGSDAA